MPNRTKYVRGHYLAKGMFLSRKKLDILNNNRIRKILWVDFFFLSKIPTGRGSAFFVFPRKVNTEWEEK
jgi:hypothetical protein